VAGALLHVLRLAPLAVTSPLLGGPLLPGPVRMALAAGLGCSAWLLSGASPCALALLPWLAAAARELALGAVLAVVAAVPIEAARAAGRLADTLRGATLAELHVAPLRQRETALGDLLVQQLVVLAATGGGLAAVVRALLLGFALVPAGAPFDPVRAEALALRASAALLATALAVAAPAAAGVLAADLAVAAMARAAPGLALPEVAQPARASIGLLAVALASSAAAGKLVALLALASEWPSALGPGGVAP
jgi:type III secretory pathway component EscT